MVIFKQPEDLQQYLSQVNKKIGYIPTMGALHRGHTSLIGKAKEDGRLTVCSIFVNPTQFNDPEDYRLYPISTGQDIQLLQEAQCDVLFLPDVSAVYPEGPENAATYDFEELGSVLEGAHRPGHFKGVGQVVARLLEIIQPDYLYMGQKDFQQCMIIKKLIGLMGIENTTEMIVCPTVREEDGLAMSSRNRRLTEPQRAIATLLYQCLVSIVAKSGIDKWEIVKKECMELLRDKGFEPEYIALADADTLEEIAEYDANRKMVALIAARLGKVRLIDNMLL